VALGFLVYYRYWVTAITGLILVTAECDRDFEYDLLMGVRNGCWFNIKSVFDEGAKCCDD